MAKSRVPAATPSLITLPVPSAPVKAPAKPVLNRDAIAQLIAAVGGADALRAALGVAAEPVAEAPAAKAKPSWPSFLITPQQAAELHGVTVSRKGNTFVVVIDPDAVTVDAGRSKSGKSEHLAKPPSIGLSEDGKLRLSVDLCLFD